MPVQTFGILLALGTAICWCFSAIAFEEAGRRAGSVPVNLLRLCVAFALLTLASTLTRAHSLPTDATPYQWHWLLLSGVIGFFVGDITLFRAFVLIGARVAALIGCTAAIFSLIAEQFLVARTHVTLLQVLGILTTLAGVILVTSEKRAAHPAYRITPWGVLLAVIGAAGQGTGAAMTSRAFELGSYDTFATGQIRMIAGIAIFAIFALATGRTRDVGRTLKNGPAMGFLSLGAFFGPFVGVSLFIKSLNYIPASLTQTMSSLTPILIIPLSVVIRHEKVTARAAVGAAIAVGGVCLIILGR